MANQMEFFNPGRLPEGITVEKLLKGDYISVIRNKKIADMFKEAGLIEKYGAGIHRVLTGFQSYGLPAPRFEEFSGGFRVTVYKQGSRAAIPEVAGEVTGEVADQVATKSGPSRDQIEIMAKLFSEQGILELMGILGRANRTKFRDQVLTPLIELGLVEMTIPDKPRSSRQKYRLTEKGRQFLTNL